MILHSSSFILHFAKDQLSQRESRRMKHGLSHDETLPFAQRNLTFGKSVFCKPSGYRQAIA